MTAPGSLGASVSAHPRGSLLSLTVSPRASANRLEQQADGTLRIRLTAPPVDGAANAALLKVLAKVLDLPRTRLSIAAGETSRRKRLLVEKMPPEELQARLNVALGQSHT